MKWFALFGVLLIQGCVGQTSTTNPTSTTIKQRVTTLENLVVSLQKQSTSSEQKYAALISNILATLSTNSDEIRNLKSINDHLLQARNATLKTLAQTQTQLGTVSKELADLKLEYNKCYQRSLKLESVLNITREDVLDVQSNITDVQFKIRAVLPSIHGPTPNVSKIAEISSKVITLETSFSQSEAKLRLFLTKINANSQDIASSRINITKLENDMATIHTSINTKIVDLTKKVNANTHDASNARSTAESANSKISQLTLTSKAATADHKSIFTLTNNLRTTSSLVNTLKRQYSSLLRTVTSLKSSSHSNSYYFKILLQHDLSPKDGAVLKFSVAPGSVTGSGYSSSTGKFTAPVSGTYVFWADIPVSRTGLGYIYIVKDGTAFARGVTVQTKRGLVRSVWGVTPLKKGQQVWFMKDGDRIQTTFNGNGKSSYGGAILHSG